ncbi:hypothetical protein [Pseudoduganella aquatica]|uniref:hypothetical protein n=1 Tax=Pseudoduganella aquatica TaxID=2660641 RepID=UPI001E50F0F8|nr:hypothetical protein [Pseudoduganella aquatica]
MVKRLIYMLTIAFALQLSWGVVSAYCQHETGKASRHFGHHQHEHKPGNVVADAEKSTPAKKVTAHPDCASCNHHGSFALASWNPEPSPLPLAVMHHQSTVFELPLPYLGLPERPQWQRVA